MRVKVLIAIAVCISSYLATAGELSGTASYRERIALPADATFQAILYDISGNDQVEIGRFEAPGDAGPPYLFSIEYADERVAKDGLYSVMARVVWPDRAYVTAGAILEGFPAVRPALELVMVRPGPSLAQPTTSTSIATPERKTNMIGAHGLALPATFTGVIQEPAGAVEWALALASDQTFQLSRSFPSGQRDSLGRWVADPAAGTLVLNDGAELPLLIRPTASGTLSVIDANSGEKHDGLLKLAAADALALSNMTMAGMVTYMADAAIFEECVSGAVFLISAEGDYLALERAYLADRSGPGAPLYMMLDGGIDTRPAMEGPDRQMIIVDRFLRTQPEMNCVRKQPEVTLINTYWRLQELEGRKFPMDATRLEPHLVLEDTETAAYRATVGCNRMRGSFQLAGEALTVSPAASTMMACPEPLDTLERQFGEVLSRVTRYNIEGNALILTDESGAPLATFSAMYF